SHGTRILAGRLEPGNAAAAIDDDRQAEITLAETVQQYVLQVDGTRDEQRTAEVRNEAGGGRSISYIVVPSVLHQEDEGGLVYTAVFGEGDERWWLAYLTDTQRSAPGSPCVDRIVNDIRRAGRAPRPAGPGGRGSPRCGPCARRSPTTLPGSTRSRTPGSADC